MNRTSRVRRLVAAVLTCAATAAFRPARADVAPPVEIKMIGVTTPAENGTEYAGSFEVHVFRPGTLTGFQIEGEGWAVTAADYPPVPMQAPMGTFVIPFRATPTDADSPIALRFSYNGRRVRQQYELGPRYFKTAGKPRLALSNPGTTGLKPSFDGQISVEPNAYEGPDGVALGGAIPLHFVGRIVYDRPGRDLSNPPDGDFDDPEDIPPATIGVDSIGVYVQDSDDFFQELIWSGLTDENGYFDSGVVMWDDCDILGCDDPDLQVYYDTHRTGWVDVTDNSVAEWTYNWTTPEITDFQGSFYDFGEISPPDPADHPALHIYNNITRTRRYLAEKPGYLVSEVQVEWPDDSMGDGAWYEDGSVEIHVSTERQWRTDTHSHEYGHHFIYALYDADPPDPNYCNGQCDPNPPDDCGHCRWCWENQYDAWGEAWPNWLADIVTRDMKSRYTMNDGSAFVPLFTRDLEWTNICNGSFNDPIKTEGFVGALLRDMEDPNQDDHDDDPDPNTWSSDGIGDQLCLGYDEIFYVLDAYQPNTVLEFINGFLNSYPEYTANMWPTAFNVGGSAYVSSTFFTDFLAPGEVSNLDSSTHPLGIGGSLPCIRFEFDPAPDDVTGASTYSYDWTTNPAGISPDEIADPVVGTQTCQLSGVVSVWQLGPVYISIRAKDNDGHWSSQFATFGPFEIIDCNGSGLLDVCDISCSTNSVDGLCWTPTSPCTGQPGCHSSFDCNENAIPDECDIASGTSEDCNNDGIPDECQTDIIKHFVGAREGNPGEEEEWQWPSNWLEGELPVDGDHVCVPSGIPASRVVYHQDYTQLTTLNCSVDFTMNGATTPWPDLELDDLSFINGDLTMTGNSTLHGNDALYVGGTFNWLGGVMRNGGTTTVANGMNLTGSTGQLWYGHHLIISGGNVDASASVSFSGGSELTIGPGVTYDYSGNFRIFDGGPTTPVHVYGVLERTAAAGTHITSYGFIDNAGLVHNQVGELTQSYGATHSGTLLSDPGTSLHLGGDQSFMPGSSLEVDDIELLGNNCTIEGSVDIGGTLKINGGTTTFTNQANVTSYGQDLFARSGTLRFESPAAVNYPSILVGEGNYGSTVHFDTGQPASVDTLTLVNGTIDGNDPLTINTSLSWLNGRFFSGGAITCDAPSTVQYTSSQRDLYRTFNNSDYATFLGGFTLNSGGHYHNLATGTIELQGNNTGMAGGGTVTNDGLIVKTAGTNPTSPSNIGYNVTNSGLILVEIGALNLGGSTSVNTGDIVGDPNTTLRMLGSWEMPIGSSFTADNVYISGNASNISGDVDISSDVTMYSGGPWKFTSDANVTSYGQTLIVRSGNIHFEAPLSGGQPITIDSVTIGEGNYGGIPHFDSGQPVSIDSLTMINGQIYGSDPVTINDTWTWNGGSLFNGGDFTNDGTATYNGGSYCYRDVNNAGTFTIANGGVNLSNSEFRNLPGGTLDIRDDGTVFGLSTNSALYNDGTMLKSAGVGDSTISVHFENAGTLELQTGNLSLYGGYNLTHQQTGGQTVLNGGGLIVGSPAVYELLGGDLTGNGTVAGDVDNAGGSVMPGLSAGSLIIDGDYTQQAGGSYDVEIGGTGAGEFDVLAVTGTATLAGTLNVSTINGYTPMDGDSFVILSAASISGVFDAVNAPNGFDIAYSATEVTLNASGTVFFGDLDGDCDVDLADLAILIGNYDIMSGMTYQDGDLDGDGDVDISDLAALISVYDTSCP